MSSKITPYTILGVSPHATIAEIRSAKNKLVIKPHPDKITDETKFEELSRQFWNAQRAYEYLCAREDARELARSKGKLAEEKGRGEEELSSECLSLSRRLLTKSPRLNRFGPSHLILSPLVHFNLLRSSRIIGLATIRNVQHRKKLDLNTMDT